MKKGMIFILMCIMTLTGFSQVSWNFSVKKIGDKRYEVHLAGTVNQPWHIYSQNTPAGGPFGSEIVFNKNPLVELKGKAKEFGKLKEKYEDVFGVDVKYYNDKIDFVQMVILKSKAKTNLTGTVEYMVCNDHECMPPKKASFTVALK